MEAHVKTLAVLFICLGAFGALAAVLILIMFGGAAGIVAGSAEASDAVFAVPILGLTGSVLALVVLVLSLPGIVAGIGLIRFRVWGRVVGLVLSALNLVNFPIGTVIGVYGLWVLLAKETEALFENQPAAFRA